MLIRLIPPPKRPLLRLFRGRNHLVDVFLVQADRVRNSRQVDADESILANPRDFAGKAHSVADFDFSSHQQYLALGQQEAR